MDENKNPWKTLTSEIVHDNPWIKVVHHDVINPAGNKGIYDVVHFKNLAIGIIPIDENYNTWLIGQYRYPFNKYTWEIPEGGGDPNVSPLESAKRELLEETGIKAQRFDKIIEMDLSNSATDEHAIIYLARDLSFHSSNPEETEELQIKKISFEEAYNMVINAEINDSLSVAGILRLKLMLMEGNGKL